MATMACLKWGLDLASLLRACGVFGLCILLSAFRDYAVITEYESYVLRARSNCPSGVASPTGLSSGSMGLVIKSKEN